VYGRVRPAPYPTGARPARLPATRSPAGRREAARPALLWLRLCRDSELAVGSVAVTVSSVCVRDLIQGGRRGSADSVVGRHGGCGLTQLVRGWPDQGRRGVTQDNAIL